MSVSALSAVSLCAEQKIVPELPIRKLSRTLSGAAEAGAIPAMQEIAAAMAIAVLRIELLRSNVWTVADSGIAAAGHRIVDRRDDGHGPGVQQAERSIEAGLIIAAVLAVLVLILL